MKHATSDPTQEAALDRVADRLTIICGYSELLQEGTYGRLTQRQRRILEMLTREARAAGLLFLEMLPLRGAGRPRRGVQSALRRSRA